MTSGRYVVRLPDGADGDPQLIAPVGYPPGMPEELQEKYGPPMFWAYTLSRVHGTCVRKFERYSGKGVKEAETELDLTEAAPGLWLAAHGVSRQLPYAKGVEALESEFWLESGSLKINAGLKEAFFDPDFPAGTRVWDDVTKSQFVEGEKTGGSEPDLAGLASRAQQMVPVQPSPSGPVEGWTWMHTVADVTVRPIA